MTTLVGIHKPGWGTVIGSDTQITCSYLKEHLPVGKWFINGGWAIGVAGALRGMNLIEHSLPHLTHNLSSPMEFTDRIRAIFKADKLFDKDDGEELAAKKRLGAAISNQFLLANPNGLWVIDDDLSYLAAPPNLLVAHGSGCSYARGAGTAADKLKVTDPIKRVKVAIESACVHDPASGGDPFIAVLSEKKITVRRCRIS